MADIKSPEERSQNMSRIRGKDTKQEVYIRKKLFELGYRYRKNAPEIIGRPDLWLAKYNTAVFVNGCFWHRHKDCKYAYVPKSRVEFWQRKFDSNIRRDRMVREALVGQGKRILIIWECSIKTMMKSEEQEEGFLNRIRAFIGSEDQFMEI